MRRFSAALLAVLATGFLVPTPALAHASLISVDPVPGSVLPALPALIRLHFSEPVTPFGRGIDVYSPDGRRVSGTAVATGNTLVGTPGDFPTQPDGTYLVEWRVVAQDTHPSRGTFTFSVGHPSAVARVGLQAGDLGAVAPTGLLLQAVARWLHFLGFALSFGVLAFQLLVLREPKQPERLRKLVYLGVALLVLAEPLALVAQAASLGSVDSASLADVLGSPFGRVLALRAAGALALWGILGAPREALGAGIWSVLAVGGLLAVVDGFSGHTISGVPVAASALLTAVHEASMVAWVGGFAGLLAVIGAVPDPIGLSRRFGRFAALTVAVLLVSGGALALVHLRAPADLISGAYGLTLAAKLVAVGVALGLAWTGLHAHRSGRPELITLAGVLALAALLASLPPPR